MFFTEPPPQIILLRALQVSLIESLEDVAEAAEQEAGEIAQTPEAIREKLAERDHASHGKATFEGKDIDNPNERYSSPPPPRPK